MPRDRLHPAYRALAAVLGAAFIAYDIWAITGGHRDMAPATLLIGGALLGTLFLYCAATGIQMHFPHESSDS